MAKQGAEWLTLDVKGPKGFLLAVGAGRSSIDCGTTWRSFIGYCHVRSWTVLLAIVLLLLDIEGSERHLFAIEGHEGLIFAK